MAKKTPAKKTPPKKKVPVKKKVVKTATTSAAKEVPVVEVEEPKSGSDSTGRSFIGRSGFLEIDGMTLKEMKAELKKTGATGLSKMKRHELTKLAFELLWAPDPPDTMTHEDVMSLNMYQRTLEVAFHNLCKHYKIPKTNTAAWGKFYYDPARMGHYACYHESFCGETRRMTSRKAFSSSSSDAWLFASFSSPSICLLVDVYQGRKEAGTLPPGFSLETAGDPDPFETPYCCWDLNADEAASVCVGFARLFLCMLFSEFEGQAHVERKCTGAWNPPETPWDLQGTPAELRDEEERKAYAKGFTEAFNSMRAHIKCTKKESKTEAQVERERLFNDVLEECCKRAGQTFVKDQWKERIKESKNGLDDEPFDEEEI